MAGGPSGREPVGVAGWGPGEARARGAGAGAEGCAEPPTPDATPSALWAGALPALPASPPAPRRQRPQPPGRARASAAPGAPFLRAAEAHLPRPATATATARGGVRRAALPGAAGEAAPHLVSERLVTWPRSALGLSAPASPCSGGRGAAARLVPPRSTGPQRPSGPQRKRLQGWASVTPVLPARSLCSSFPGASTPGPPWPRPLPGVKTSGPPGRSCRTPSPHPTPVSIFTKHRMPSPSRQVPKLSLLPSWPKVSFPGRCHGQLFRRKIV